jgi:hypothetical protein
MVSIEVPAREAAVSTAPNGFSSLTFSPAAWIWANAASPTLPICDSACLICSAPSSAMRWVIVEPAIKSIP